MSYMYNIIFYKWCFWLRGFQWGIMLNPPEHVSFRTKPLLQTTLVMFVDHVWIDRHFIILPISFPFPLPSSPPHTPSFGHATVILRCLFILQNTLVENHRKVPWSTTPVMHVPDVETSCSVSVVRRIRSADARHVVVCRVVWPVCQYARHRWPVTNSSTHSLIYLHATASLAGTPKRFVERIFLRIRC